MPESKPVGQHRKSSQPQTVRRHRIRCVAMRLWRQEVMMNSAVSEVPVVRGGHPILWIFAAFPITCFTCALFADAAYMQTTNIMWANFSDWLLAAGMAGGMLAAIVGLFGWIT